MLHKTKIGVCMDFGVAYLLEEKNDEKVITIIEADSEVDFATVVDGSTKTQHKGHLKPHSFYKKVYEIIKDFDKVSIFGPESVKKELLNRIKAGNLEHIEIQNKSNPDRITEKEKIDFINEYFNT